MKGNGLASASGRCDKDITGSLTGPLLFGVLFGMDRGPRASFARGQILAPIQGVSVSTINHHLAARLQTLTAANGGRLMFGTS